MMPISIGLSGRILQNSLDGAIQTDLRELERAGVSEMVKNAKRQRIRLRGDPSRPRRKRRVLDADYTAGGEVIESDSDVAAAIAAEWEPVMERDTHDDARAFFAAHIPRGGGEGEWSGREAKSGTRRLIVPSRRRDPSGVAAEHSYAELC